MKRPILATVIALATACQALPELPSNDAVPIPTTLRLVEAPARLAAGAWTRVTVEVLDQSEQLMAGQVVTAAVRVPQGEAPGVAPGLGNSCRTGLAGEACPIPLKSEGPVGRFIVVLTTGSVAPIEYQIDVVPAPEGARLTVVAPERAPFFFVNGQTDALRLEAPLPLLGGGDPVAVRLTLVDAFGNPIAALLRAELVLDNAPAPPSNNDAGVAPDAATDGGQPSDAAQGDGAAPDTAAQEPTLPDASADAAAPDASADAAPLDAAAPDAGAEPGLPLRLALGADCSGALASSAEAVRETIGVL